MKNKSLIFIIIILISFFFLVKHLSIKYSKEIKDPIFKSFFGEKFIKVGDNKIISIIENEYCNGNIIKINLSLESIDINTFKKIDSNKISISMFEDKSYIYTVYDGEEKIIIREKK